MRAVFKLLGLGQRAHSVVSGDEAVRAKLERRQAKLLIIAGDAAASTKNDFTTLAKRYGVAYAIYGQKEDLGAAVGKSPRAVVALLDDNLAARIKSLLTQPEDQAPVSR